MTIDLSNIPNIEAIRPEATPFTMLAIQPAFKIDEEILNRHYQILQVTLHPDKYPKDSHEGRVAEAMLGWVNNAYAELKDPMKRARVLFRVSIIPVPGGENRTIDDPEIMEEALLVKEQLESARGHYEALSELCTFLGRQIDQLSEQFDTAFHHKNKKGMVQSYLRLSFFMKTVDDAKQAMFVIDQQEIQQLNEEKAYAAAIV
jgi:molecular chaperone HscB